MKMKKLTTKESNVVSFDTFEEKRRQREVAAEPLAVQLPTSKADLIVYTIDIIKNVSLRRMYLKYASAEMDNFLQTVASGKTKLTELSAELDAMEYSEVLNQALQWLNRQNQVDLAQADEMRRIRTQKYLAEQIERDQRKKLFGILPPPEQQ